MTPLYLNSSMEWANEREIVCVCVLELECSEGWLCMRMKDFFEGRKGESKRLCLIESE